MKDIHFIETIEYLSVKFQEILENKVPNDQDDKLYFECDVRCADCVKDFYISNIFCNASFSFFFSRQSHAGLRSTLNGHVESIA